VLDVAIMIEGQDGSTWHAGVDLSGALRTRFTGLYRSDHFTNPTGPNRDTLELWSSLTWLASYTSRIELGTLVSPVSFRPGNYRLDSNRRRRSRWRSAPTRLGRRLAGTALVNHSHATIAGAIAPYHHKRIKVNQRAS
jgi:hypothetical protein